jgi:chromosome segregation ATPase
MNKQIERQLRESQRELADAQREKEKLRLRPCRGDAEILKKEKNLQEIDDRIESLKNNIRVLERKRREATMGETKVGEYESPFS